MNETKKPAVRFKGFSVEWERHPMDELTTELHEYATLDSLYPLLTSSREGIMFQNEYRSNRTTENNKTLFSIVPYGKCTYRHVFSGLFSLVQIFIAMQPDETVYFANPGPDGVFNKDFYFHWADANNEPLNNWKDIGLRLSLYSWQFWDGLLRLLRNKNGQAYPIHRTKSSLSKMRITNI